MSTYLSPKNNICVKLFQRCLFFNFEGNLFLIQTNQQNELLSLNHISGAVPTPLLCVRTGVCMCGANARLCIKQSEHINFINGRGEGASK